MKKEHYISLSSISGLKVKVSTLGARICSIVGETSKGPLEFHEYYPSIDVYRNTRKFSGATIGPYANRIANSSFSINGTKFALESNENTSCLHSGSKGFHHQIWTIQHQNEYSITFTLNLAHLEDGFPGNRTIKCKYTLVDDDILIQWEANTDQTTHFNFTNHAYFNLGLLDNLDDHFFMIKSKAVLELNDQKLPTGNQLELDNYFELNTFQRVGKRVFDHNFILNGADIHNLSAAAYCPETDVTLEVYTTQPGIQFYTGNGKYFCFETQHFPDTPNQPSFPSTIIKPSGTYKQQCIYRFDY